MTIKEREIVCKRKTVKLRAYEIGDLFGSVRDKAEKVRGFLNRSQEPEKINKCDLEEHDVAFFEKIGLNNSMSDIMCDFIVDRENGKVIAKKLFRSPCGTTMETREYPLANYGKTWRCWTGYFKTHLEGDVY